MIFFMTNHVDKSDTDAQVTENEPPEEPVVVKIDIFYEAVERLLSDE